MSKVMGVYVKFWHFITKYGQIWPCHVTQEANFKKLYFFLILHLILGKVTKFLVEKLSTSEVISQKPPGGGEKHLPSAFRVKGQFPITVQRMFCFRFVLFSLSAEISAAL